MKQTVLGGVIDTTVSEIVTRCREYYLDTGYTPPYWERIVSEDGHGHHINAAFAAIDFINPNTVRPSYDMYGQYDDPITHVRDRNAAIDDAHNILTQLCQEGLMPIGIKILPAQYVQNDYFSKFKDENFNELY